MLGLDTDSLLGLDPCSLPELGPGNLPSFRLGQARLVSVPDSIPFLLFISDGVILG